MIDSDPIVYLNGRFLPKSQAHLRVDERGTLFADGVYEVLRYYQQKPLALGLHIDRMKRSLEGIRLAQPKDFDSFPDIAQQLIRDNHLEHARVYWQITRGAAPRNPRFPLDTDPTVLVMAGPVQGLDPQAPVPTVRATLLPDERWANCWIKSLMLLPNVLAYNEALSRGFEAAILHRDGIITEATNANTMAVWDDTLWTHPADRYILNGITRQLAIRCAKERGIPVKEQVFTAEQLLEAQEVLMTGTTIHVTAVTQINDVTVGSGDVGPITQQLHETFNALIRHECLSTPSS